MRVGGGGGLMDFLIMTFSYLIPPFPLSTVFRCFPLPIFVIWCFPRVSISISIGIGVSIDIVMFIVTVGVCEAEK